MRAHGLILSLFLAASCGQKQAADPRAVLGEEMNYGGVDGRTGEPTGTPKPAVAEDDAEPASPDECREAAEHLVEFGLERAIEDEADPELKQKLKAELERGEDSDLLRQLRERWSKQWTQECLDRGDSRAEVRCILSATREEDLERCAPAE